MSIVKKYLGYANEKSKYVNEAFLESLTSIETLLVELRQPQKLPDENYKIIMSIKEKQMMQLKQSEGSDGFGN